ncbi:MAG: hypothetical protein DRN15_01500 [Thermoprotei archaeon]|nr:MAG: hypothetical protein DRN15_01500 [Thermoprotei archaeon]RLF25869.1 MAG: hypothetical protein DRM97_00395 [Thermoprotei archaeon]
MSISSKALSIVFLLIVLVTIMAIPSSAKAYTVVIVTEDAEGNALANVKVKIFKDDTLVREVTTDSNGKVSISLTEGTYKVKAYFKGVLIYEGTKPVLAVNETQQWTLPCLVYRTSVVVRTPDGEALSARVSITELGISDTCGKEGKLTLKIPLNYDTSSITLTFSVFWQDVKVFSRKYTLTTTNASTTIQITAKVYDVTIKILDATGNALPGGKWRINKVELSACEVKVKHPNGTFIETEPDSKGVIRLENMPKGTYEVRVLWWGVLVKSVDVEILEEEQLIEVKSDVYPVKLYITDGAGEPLANTNFTVVFPKLGITFNVTTDENGYIELFGMIEGEYLVELTWRGEVLRESIRIESPGLVGVKFPIYDLSMRLISKGAGHRPLSRAIILLYRRIAGREVIVYKGHSDMHGFVLVPKLPEAMYRAVVLWHNVTVADIPIALDTPLDLSVPCDVYSMKLRLVDLKHRALIRAPIRVKLANGTSITLRSDAGGIVFLSTIPKGEYELEVLWRNFTVGKRVLTLPGPAGDLEEEIVCNVYDLRIFVKGAIGQPLSEARVTLYRAGTIYSEGLTDNGIIEFSQIPGGEYLVTIDYKGVSLRTTMELTGTEPDVKWEAQLDVLFEIMGIPLGLMTGIVLIVAITVASVASYIVMMRVRARRVKLFEVSEVHREVRKRKKRKWRFPKLKRR